MEKVTAKTIEKQVAEAILQQPLGVVTLRGKDYPVSHPSPATLIIVSELCAGLPNVDAKGNMLTEVLRTARNSAVIGKIIATLILGAKRIRENHTVETTYTASSSGLWRRLFGLPDKQTTVTKKVAEIDYFANILLEDFTPSQLATLATDLFVYSEVTDFFRLTTSLCAANLIRSTTGVVTASGE